MQNEAWELIQARRFLYLEDWRKFVVVYIGKSLFDFDQNQVENRTSVYLVNAESVNRSDEENVWVLQRILENYPQVITEKPWLKELVWKVAVTCSAEQQGIVHEIFSKFLTFLVSQLELAMVSILKHSLENKTKTNIS